MLTWKVITERFRSGVVIRQGCPLSVLLFITYLEDLGERWEKKNVGGIVIGKSKIGY